ncbi:hypothetical protein [Chryseolinea lacunae]|uniref:Uncharacterized protein n=1 Tax=Chryseolinea lacunae TaxID=2801331 RepID=A0ABS1KWN7_9BACT|nr:hypothetical protein [Chryseolinea lacunae]MBL0743829.1 hypothetical protein [Chryseolinea lacunae]
MENQISLVMTEQQWKDAEAAVLTLKNLFDGKLITLTTKQRQQLAKMGDGSLPFTEKAADYAKRNPEFLPSYIKLEEFETDLLAARQLNHIYQLLSQLVTQIDDSMLASGSEAYLAARTYYASVKAAAKAHVAAAKVVEADLAERFARLGKTDSAKAEPKD